MVANIFDGSRAAFTFNQVVLSNPITQGATIIKSTATFGNVQTGSWASNPGSSNLIFSLNGTAQPVSIPDSSSTLALLILGLTILVNPKLS